MTTTEVRFERLDLEPTYRVLARRITDMVLSGELKPGDAVPTEQVLCEQFGVNRSSVREGIRLLEESGIFRRINSKRLAISRPTAAELSQQLERGLLLHEVTFQELWETAMIIEPQTAALATHHLLDSDIAALNANLAATEAALDDPRTLVRLDLEFHRLVASGVHNRVWQLTREPMVRLFYPAFEVVFSRVPESGARLLKAHRAIVEVLQARDASEATRWMERHIKDFKRGFQLASMDLDVAVLQANRASRNARRSRK